MISKANSAGTKSRSDASLGTDEALRLLAELRYQRVPATQRLDVASLCLSALESMTRSLAQPVLDDGTLPSGSLEGEPVVWDDWDPPLSDAVWNELCELAGLADPRPRRPDPKPADPANVPPQDDAEPVNSLDAGYDLLSDPCALVWSTVAAAAHAGDDWGESQQLLYAADRADD